MLDVLTAASMISVAVAIYAAIKSKRIGIVLGTRTFYAFAATFLCIAVLQVVSGISLLVEDWQSWVAIAKTIFAVVTILSCAIVNLQVRYVRRLPPESDGAFDRFRTALRQFKDMHEHEDRYIRSA